MLEMREVLGEVWKYVERGMGKCVGAGGGGGSGEVLVEMWESMLGCERRWEVCEKVLGRCGKVWREVWKSVMGVEKCRKNCGKVWEKVWSVLEFHMPPPHLLSPPIHPNTLSNTSPCPTISTYLPYTPTHFPTPHHTAHLPLPTQHTSLHLSPHLLLPPSHLPLPPPHPNALFHTSPNTSPHLPSPIPHPNTLTNIFHSPYSPHTLSHTSKKIMLKCFYIRFKPEKYVDTIVPMHPVKSVKKTKSNMPATRKHI